jgi:hypothetical protein
VLVAATNSLGVRRPVRTPWCQSTLRRSSTPPVPFGIFRKSFSPARFYGLQKQQWSVAVVCRLPDCRPFQSAAWCSFERKGGLIT